MLRRNLLNALHNVFWSLLCFAPLCVFCYQFMERSWLYSLAALSLIPYMMQKQTLRYLQLSTQPRVYRRLRVHLLTRLTQDSRWIKRSSRSAHSQTSALRDDDSLRAVVRVTFSRERFHLAMFLFFLLSAVYAALGKHFAWSLLLCLSNLIYNVYPIWMQQYIRMRLERCLARSEV
jgi:hypothetical protein